MRAGTPVGGIWSSGTYRKNSYLGERFVFWVPEIPVCNVCESTAVSFHWWRPLSGTVVGTTGYLWNALGSLSAFQDFQLLLLRDKIEIPEMSDKSQRSEKQPAPPQLTPEQQRQQRESRRDRAMVARRFFENLDEIARLEEELSRRRRNHQALLREFPFLGNVYGEVNRLPAKRPAEEPEDVEMAVPEETAKAGSSAKRARHDGRKGLEKKLRFLEDQSRGIERDEKEANRRREEK
jgi:hypothetical protein